MRFLLLSLFPLAASLFFSCAKKKENVYVLNPKGFYYRLLDFETKKYIDPNGNIARLDVEFATQDDSVFWDSHNNLADQFFLRADSASTDFLSVQAALCSEGDSVELLVKPADFFNQRFNSAVPAFCLRDSVTRVRLRLVSFFDASSTYLMSSDPQAEKKRIAAFFGSENLALSNLDPEGFYWIGKKGTMEKINREGDVIRIRYRGSFLNGRPIDQGFQEMDVELGTPDQVLPGLNYVIQRLKVGENAKIILPSRLAFGEQGSSDGLVPAGTPLMYEVKLMSK